MAAQRLGGVSGTPCKQFLPKASQELAADVFCGARCKWSNVTLVQVHTRRDKGHLLEACGIAFTYHLQSLTRSHYWSSKENHKPLKRTVVEPVGPEWQ